MGAALRSLIPFLTQVKGVDSSILRTEYCGFTVVIFSVFDDSIVSSSGTWHVRTPVGDCLRME